MSLFYKMPLLQQPNCQRTPEPTKTRAATFRLPPELSRFRCRMDRGQTHLTAASRRQPREPGHRPSDTQPHPSQTTTPGSRLSPALLFAPWGKQMILLETKTSSRGLTPIAKKFIARSDDPGTLPGRQSSVPADSSPTSSRRVARRQVRIPQEPNHNKALANAFCRTWRRSPNEGPGPGTACFGKRCGCL